MAVSLIPSIILNRLTEITPELLQKRGITFLMLDFDNTIVPYTTNVPTQEVEDWFLNMKQSSIVLCMVSNSKKPRVRLFCEEHGIPCIQHAKKPFWRAGIRKAMEQFGCGVSESAIVGDQIFTDTLGGNGAGITTILVTPIDNHNIWLKLRHVAEKPFIALGKRRISREKP